MSRWILTCTLMLSSAPWADVDHFHGWSKDGTWLVYEQRSSDERVELYFCATEPEGKPSWPPALSELEREPGALSCVRFLDPNKAPYRWKEKLLLPAPSMQQGNISIAHELSTDGETPGFVLLVGDKKQSCYASGLRESSKLQKAWFHPNHRLVAVLIDGSFHHCMVTVPPKAPKTRR